MIQPSSSYFLQIILRFDTGLNFLYITWSNDGFFNSDCKTASFIDVGTWLESSDRLTILQMTGMRTSRLLITSFDGRGSREQDLDRVNRIISDSSSTVVGRSVFSSQLRWGVSITRAVNGAKSDTSITASSCLIMVIFPSKKFANRLASSETDDHDGYNFIDFLWSSWSMVRKSLFWSDTESSMREV